ncbi:MAG: asparagine synthase (glutamine-hydrolyzing) [Halioglobus sp.]|jgi:asparagine synthase (glutamine-hydrolysing)
MCGIAGIFDLKGQSELDRNILHAMNQSQFHRGPDEAGLHLAPGVALAHRRLSIIDLSSGQQPMLSENGDLCLVYNGEIYNFQELAEELRAKGYRFRTRCDTEVVLYAWQEWGEACVEKFRGMFAFALFDRRRQSLFLARDRLGIKPLYYSELGDGTLLFGSELKALLAHPKLQRKLCNEAVEDYFALGYIPDPKTILQGVYKLPPGHTLTLKKGKFGTQPKQYWDVPFDIERGRGTEALERELIGRLTESVDIRMVADVPLGAFLSGGVDSSAVVALMSGLQKEPVNTCSIGFDVNQFDETQYAQQVAEQYKTNHQVSMVDSDDFALLDSLAAMYDEPFADSSAIPTYRVCQAARKGVVVALSGDGGDELFAGYRRHRWHMNEEKFRAMLPLGLRSTVFGLAGKIYPKMDWAPRVLRAKSTLQALSLDSLEAYMQTVSVSTSLQRRSLFSEQFKQDLQGYEALENFRHHAARCPAKDPLSLIQYIDMKTYLPGDILTKVDRASMANSLEVRVPLLDHKFVEWASGLPPELKLEKQEGKAIFKKSLKPYLSKDILYRDKMGFGVPLAKWFRGPLKSRITETLVEGGLADMGLFDKNELSTIARQHVSGQREHSALIWALLMFESSTRQLGLNL